MTRESDDKSRRAQDRSADGVSADDVAQAMADGWGEYVESSAASASASKYDEAAAEIEASESDAHAPVVAGGAADAPADHESAAPADGAGDEQDEEEEDDVEARRAAAFAELRTTREVLIASTSEEERKRQDRRFFSYAVAITVGSLVLFVCLDLAFTYITQNIDGAMVPGQANKEILAGGERMISPSSGAVQPGALAAVGDGTRDFEGRGGAGSELFQALGPGDEGGAGGFELVPDPAAEEESEQRVPTWLVVLISSILGVVAGAATRWAMEILMRDPKSVRALAFSLAGCAFLIGGVTSLAEYSAGTSGAGAADGGAEGSSSFPGSSEGLVAAGDASDRSDRSDGSGDGLSLEPDAAGTEASIADFVAQLEGPAETPFARMAGSLESRAAVASGQSSAAPRRGGDTITAFVGELEPASACASIETPFARMACEARDGEEQDIDADTVFALADGSGEGSGEGSEDNTLLASATEEPVEGTDPGRGEGDNDSSDVAHGEHGEEGSGDASPSEADAEQAAMETASPESDALEDAPATEPLEPAPAPGDEPAEASPELNAPSEETPPAPHVASAVGPDGEPMPDSVALPPPVDADAIEAAEAQQGASKGAPAASAPERGGTEIPEPRPRRSGHAGALLGFAFGVSWRRRSSTLDT